MAIRLDNEKIEFVSNVYNVIQDMISLADNKANILLSIQSLLVSIGLGTSILSKTFESVKDIDNIVLYRFFYIIVISLTISSIMGIALTLFVFRARSNSKDSKKKSKGLLYFGHIANLQNPDDYYNKINNISESEILKEYSYQIYNVSKIANKKMKYLNRSIYFLILNLILTIILLLLNIHINTI